MITDEDLFSPDEIDELRKLGEVYSFTEAGVKAIIVKGIQIGDRILDILLWPAPRDGYPSRLFLSEQVPCKKPVTWSTARIAERNWTVISWMLTPGPLRLAQMVALHLAAFK